MKHEKHEMHDIKWKTVTLLCIMDNTIYLGPPYRHKATIKITLYDFKNTGILMVNLKVSQFIDFSPQKWNYFPPATVTGSPTCLTKQENLNAANVYWFPGGTRRYVDRWIDLVVLCKRHLISWEDRKDLRTIFGLNGGWISLAASRSQLSIRKKAWSMISCLLFIPNLFDGCFWRSWKKSFLASFLTNKWCLAFESRNEISILDHIKTNHCEGN